MQGRLPRHAPETEKGGNRIFLRHGWKKNTSDIHIMTAKKENKKKGVRGGCMFLHQMNNNALFEPKKQEKGVKRVTRCGHVFLIIYIIYIYI
jgi:hypothetical protein